MTNMWKYYKYLLVPMLFILIGAQSNLYASGKDSSLKAKHVRNYINKGNTAYRNNDFSEAEAMYKNALQEDANSEIAMFNLALALIKQKALKNDNSKESDDLFSNPKALLENVASISKDEELVAKAFYNLGNIAFDGNDYRSSIEYYKESLRRQPDNLKTRQNLRIAQLKLQNEEQNQNQDNKNQDQQNQDKQDNKQQQQQQQNQDQNKDNNKSEQNKEDQKNNEKQNQNGGSQNKPENKSDNQSSSSQGKSSISKENAEKILNSVAKQEEQTRKKVEKQMRDNTSRRTTGNPW